MKPSHCTKDILKFKMMVLRLKGTSIGNKWWFRNILEVWENISSSNYIIIVSTSCSYHATLSLLVVWFLQVNFVSFIVSHFGSNFYTFFIQSIFQRASQWYRQFMILVSIFYKKYIFSEVALGHSYFGNFQGSIRTHRVPFQVPLFQKCMIFCVLYGGNHGLFLLCIKIVVLVFLPLKAFVFIEIKSILHIL